jgi:hypothetical protein
MIRRLKDSHGYPEGMTEVEWNEKLEIMAEGFEAAWRILELDYPEDVHGPALKALMDSDENTYKLGMAVFTENFFGLWD